MFNRAIQLLIVAGLMLIATTDAEAAGSQAPAIKRVAKNVGLALKRNNRSNVRLVRGEETEVGRKLEAEFVKALEATDFVDKVEDDAKFAIKIEYTRSGNRVSMEVILLDRSNHSLGKFSANFDLEDE